MMMACTESVMMMMMIVIFFLKETFSYDDPHCYCPLHTPYRLANETEQQLEDDYPKGKHEPDLSITIFFARRWGNLGDRCS